MAIIRIVRLSFEERGIDEFFSIFEESKNLIRSFEGCTCLELLKDHNHSNVFYTHSKWKSNDALEKYRESELFKTTWQKTKLLFNAKPQAFTLEKFISDGA